METKTNKKLAKQKLPKGIKKPIGKKIKNHGICLVLANCCSSLGPAVSVVNRPSETSMEKLTFPFPEDINCK